MKNKRQIGKKQLSSSDNIIDPQNDFAKEKQLDGDTIFEMLFRVCQYFEDSYHQNDITHLNLFKKNVEKNEQKLITAYDKVSFQIPLL